ncbi:acyltransferase [Succinimonas amylolytica]|uniref:acyltransferase n=1 Tax=Succinimonas amylolytica TaxID=83769 RepID=UPI000367CC20|nr:hypothetical protein [Succinimonas amylolytica]
MIIPIAENAFIRDMGNGNRIVLNHHDRDLTKTKVVFGNNSHDNSLVLDKNITLNNSIIEFKGSNSVVYIDESKRNYKIIAIIYNHSLLYIGKNCYFNDFNNSKTVFLVYEHQNIVIGNGCIVSYGVTFRNSDGHLIYDIDTCKRINKSKSIIIGDHVWIGQNCLILKGTFVGSGSIIGANSVVSGKTIQSNSIWAGNPARELKRGIYWLSTSSNSWEPEESIKYDTLENRKVVYRSNNKDSLINHVDDITLEFLLKYDKNRFSI